VLVGVSRFFAEAYDARIRESEGWAGLQRHLAALILRARELDPSLRAGATLSEAIVVLKRHGEPLGISDEVLEIAIERCRRNSCRWPGRCGRLRTPCARLRASRN
jgi:hypothetical protein